MIEKHMNTFSERLYALRTEKRLSQAKLAKLAGVPQSTIAQIESGRTKSTRKIIELAEVLGTTPNYLLNGIANLKTPPSPSGVSSYSGYVSIDKEIYVIIPYYDIRILPETSNASWVTKTPAVELIFHKSWFEQRKLNPSCVKAMHVRGKSMEPFLYDMDTILLNQSDTEVIDGDIYAIVYKNRLYIRELRASENGFNIISYHSDYEIMRATQETIKELSVLGKMIWRGG